MRKSKPVKWNKYALFTAAAVAMCAAPFVLMSVDATTEPVGNEEMSALPSWRNEDGTPDNEYLSELGEYITERLALRPRMITADSLAKDKLFDTSSQESVIAGTDGWLYYSATLDDYQHNNNVSERVLFNEAHNVKLMQEYVEGTGGRFLFTIAPNKNTLYDGNMPAQYRIQVAEKSDFERLIPCLEAEGVNYIDLDSLFRRQRKILYYARDSHWNEQGAVLVYNALLDAADKEHADYADVSPSLSHDYYGDLGKMIYPSGAEPEDRLDYLSDPSYFYTTGTESVEEDYIETKNPDAAGSLLMYRDSFGNSLLPYLAEAYGNAVFSKEVPYDAASDLEHVTGKVASGNGTAATVIVERVERHLPTLSRVPAVMPAPEAAIRICPDESRYPGTDSRQAAMDEAMGEEADPADRREIVSYCDRSGGDGNDSCLETEGSSDGKYIVMTGSVDDRIAETDSEILVSVTDLNETHVYEAFCVDQDATDFGFLLYVPADSPDGGTEGIIDIKVIVKTGDVYTAVLDQRSSDFDEVMGSWQKEAEEMAEEEAAAGEMAAEGSPVEKPAAGEKKSSEGNAGEKAAESAETETYTAESAETGDDSPKQAKTPEKKEKSGGTADGSSQKSGTVKALTENAEAARTQTDGSSSGESTGEQTAAADVSQETGTQAGSTGPEEGSGQEQEAGSTGPEEGSGQEQETGSTGPEGNSAQEQENGSGGVHEVSRQYFEDCGYDTGYWVITFSDGHQEVLEE